MATLKQPLQDILTKLSALIVTNQDGQSVNLYARVWNNHLRDLRDGNIYEWPRPAAFVELVSPIMFQNIGSGVRSAELSVRIHLIHDFYNIEGSFEQDLTIFDLRDQVLLSFIDYVPTGCGTLLCTSETQDYDHDNLYHYILEFTTHYRDSKNSRYDSDAGLFVDTADANLTSIIHATKGSTAAYTPDITYFIIP